MAEPRLSPCQMLAGNGSGGAVDISVDATARVVDSRVCSDRSCSAHEPSEASADNEKGGHCHRHGGHFCAAQ